MIRTGANGGGRHQHNDQDLGAWADPARYPYLTKLANIAPLTPAVVAEGAAWERRKAPRVGPARWAELCSEREEN